MKRFLPTLALLLAHIGFVPAQNIPTRLEFGGLLWSENDSFSVRAPNWDEDYTFATTGADTIDLGTDGFLGQYITVWTSTDTLVVPYVNAPYEQWIFIRVGSRKDTTVYLLHFNRVRSVFPDSYVKEHKGKTAIEIPEVYELANIVLYLSDCSRKTMNHPDDTEYSREVEAYFRPVAHHKLIRLLNEKCQREDYWDTYYGFRENSICYTVSEGRLSFESPYKMVWFNRVAAFGGEFGSMLYLVQDFMEKSRFRDFYAAHQTYYRRLEKRQGELLPLSKMWKWLEQEFPTRMDGYKVIFSPLIGGSHSTQRFYEGNYEAPAYRECVMFINSPESMDARASEPEKIKEGLMSGIVFTEIDHNYVNPASYEFRQQIRSLMANKDFWATKEEQKNYPNELSIFNEYMTHAAFCLYVREHYARNQADTIIEQRIKLMERRGYLRFREFNTVLLKLTEHRSSTLYQLYGSIIEEMKKLK